MTGRTGLIGLALLVLAGCAGGFPEQSRDRAACVPYFVEYDRITRNATAQLIDRRFGPSVVASRRSQLTVLLIQNDCLTRARDIQNLDAVAQSRAGRPVTQSGPALPRPVAVHVGALTSDADAARAIAFFQSLGVRATGQGAGRLGRRVYAGMIRTEGGLADLIALAREAGFVAPYASETFRF